MEASNKIIAEFMDWTEDFDSITHEGNKWWSDPNTHKYHTSWDWLMPVLKKINIQLNPNNYNDWRMINRPTEYYLEEVYAQVVHFISEYNQNN
jgi:hypothetical protein